MSYDTSLCISQMGSQIVLGPRNVDSQWAWNTNGDFRLCKYNDLRTCLLNNNGLIENANHLSIGPYGPYDILGEGGNFYIVHLVSGLKIIFFAEILSWKISNLRH